VALPRNGAFPGWNKGPVTIVDGRGKLKELGSYNHPTPSAGACIPPSPSPGPHCLSLSLVGKHAQRLTQGVASANANESNHCWMELSIQPLVGCHGDPAAAASPIRQCRQLQPPHCPSWQFSSNCEGFHDNREVPSGMRPDSMVRPTLYSPRRISPHLHACMHVYMNG